MRRIKSSKNFFNPTFKIIYAMFVFPFSLFPSRPSYLCDVSGTVMEKFSWIISKHWTYIKLMWRKLSLCEGKEGGYGWNSRVGWITVNILQFTLVPSFFHFSVWLYFHSQILICKVKWEAENKKDKYKLLQWNKSQNFAMYDTTRKRSMSSKKGKYYGGSMFFVVLPNRIHIFFIDFKPFYRGGKCKIKWNEKLFRY